MSLVITIALVVLGVALVVVFLNRGKDEEKAKKQIIGILVASVILAGLRIFMTGADAGSELAYDPAPDDAIAKVMASRIAAASDGRRMVILAEMRQPGQAEQARLKAFSEEAEKLGMQILGVEPAFPDLVVEEGVFMVNSPGVKADAIQNALNKYGDADVLVCLVGMPDESAAGLGRRLSEIDFFAMDPHVSFGWAPLLGSGILDGAIVPMIRSDAWNEEASTPEEIFDNQFVFVTRENYAEKRPLFDYDAPYTP